MPRPRQCRYVATTPSVTYFKPRGIPMTALEEVCLGVEELEALRLADLEGLTGSEAACRMRVSRHTFGRTLAAARRTVALALVTGRALRIVGMHTDISSLQHDRNVLEKKIRLDPLTGVYNRYHLDGLLQQVHKDRGPLSVLMADVNGLKMINDHLGHHAGDELLRTAAQQLLKHIRQEDCLARLGGDEFVMVLSCPGSVVRERLSTIRKALEAWNAAGGLPLELSFGLAGSDDGSVAPEVLDVQDTYLAERLRERDGTVDAEALPPVDAADPVLSRVAIWRGDITRLAADAIANAANDQNVFLPADQRIYQELLDGARAARHRA